jgi:hypothetical protein
VYESRRRRPLSRPHFRRRRLPRFLGASALAFGSLLFGVAGYMRFEDLGWRDVFLNAAMLLGGMGPVESPQTAGGKLFAGAYAPYSGLVFPVAAGIVLAPIVHRLLHKFRWDADQ